MDFDFKKARKNKQKQDKVRATHHVHSDRKNKTQDHDLKQRNCSTSEKDHAAISRNVEKPTLTETDPMQFQHLKRETEDIAALSETKTYKRRVIVSNWERYELPPDSLEEEIEDALDFETLIKSLSDVKGHLKLSHEQSWGNERSELQEDLFNIEMYRLLANLEKVPYHARQNLPASLFTPEQLSIFQHDADEAQKQSCSSKITARDYLPQKLPVVSAAVPTTVTNDSKLSDGTTCLPVAELKPTDNQYNSSTTNSLEANISQISENIQTTSILEKTIPRTACSKSEELDLDYLLSLDAAVPDKPRSPQKVHALPVTNTTSSEVSESGKLDDWLDDLLDS